MKRCPSSFRRCRGGFSIIELLVAMVILLIIVTVFARFFQRSSQSWESGMHNVEMAIAGRAAMNLIVRDLERAVAVPDSGNDAYDNNGSYLKFSMLRSDAPYGVVMVGYRRQGNELMRELIDPNSGTGVDTRVIENVVNVAFDPVERLENDLPAQVRIKLRLRSRYATGDPTREQEFVGRAFLAQRHRYPAVED